jgi:hypothetical protein
MTLRAGGEARGGRGLGMGAMAVTAPLWVGMGSRGMIAPFLAEG